MPGLWQNIITEIRQTLGGVPQQEVSFFVNPGSGCSKLTTLLVNISLKFQTLISNIHQYFLLKTCEKLLQCKSFSHFFNKKYHCTVELQWLEHLWYHDNMFELMSDSHCTRSGKIGISFRFFLT